MRAELELSTERYVSENTGWDRKHHLTDEQNGPYYFSDWEPGYPLAVSVEVILAEQVWATELVVKQTPYSEASGVLEFRVGTEDVLVELSGMNVWRSHAFAEPVLMDRLTITRNDVATNIVELFVCVRS